MGCCLRKSQLNHDQELPTTNAAVTCKSGQAGQNMLVTHSLSDNGFEIKGDGTCLGSCPLDCDCARWEVTVMNTSASAKIFVGVKRFNPKAPSDLSLSLEDCEEDKSSPAWYLKGAEIHNGDVIGVYWDQTDLPMLSFTINGKLSHEAAVNRIRPSNEVYPALSIRGDAKCKVIFDEAHFKYPPIAAKFKMIICSKSII